MRAVASLLSIALLGCFPHNPKARTYAKITEGSFIVGGVAMEFLANSKTGADCQMMSSIGNPQTSCHTTGTILGGVGLGMILAGLTGFIATISTAEEEKAPPPRVEVKAQPPADKHDVKLPPGVQPDPTPAPAAEPAASPEAAPTGSAAPSQPAP